MQHWVAIAIGRSVCGSALNCIGEEAPGSPVALARGVAGPERTPRPRAVAPKAIGGHLDADPLYVNAFASNRRPAERSAACLGC